MKSLQLGESCSVLPAVLSDTVAMGSNDPFSSLLPSKLPENKKKYSIIFRN